MVLKIMFYTRTFFLTIFLPGSTSESKRRTRILSAIEPYLSKKFCTATKQKKSMKFGGDDDIPERERANEKTTRFQACL